MNMDGYNNVQNQSEYKFGEFSISGVTILLLSIIIFLYASEWGGKIILNHYENINMAKYINGPKHNKIDAEYRQYKAVFTMAGKVFYSIGTASITGD